MGTNRLTSESFEKTRVLVIGDLMLDRYLKGRADRISPEAPVPVVSVESELDVAGGAANVAANVRGLGSECVLIGLVGRDSEADRLFELCTGLGIECGGFVADGSRPTTLKARVVSEGHQIARFDKESSSFAEKSVSNELLSNISNALSRVDAVIISDYGKGVVTSEVAAEILRVAVDIPVFVDPKGIKYEKYKGSKVVTPNRKELFEAATSIGFEGDDVVAAGRAVKEHFGFANLLVTLGAEGMSLFEDGGAHHHVGTTARNVFDVTGAGDTVIATLAVANASGFELERAVETANRAAGLVVESVGTTAVSIADLVSELESAEKKGSAADV